MSYEGIMSKEANWRQNSSGKPTKTTASNIELGVDQYKKLIRFRVGSLPGKISEHAFNLAS